MKICPMGRQKNPMIDLQPQSN